MRALALFVSAVLVACGGSSGGSTTGDTGSGSGGTGVTNPPPPPPPAKGGGDWLQYRHDQRGASENPAEFTVAAAAKLRRVSFATPELGQYVYTQAMIASDLVVFTTAYVGRVVAFTPSTGKQIVRDLNKQISTTCGGPKNTGFWSSVALVGDLVYAPSPDGNLYALNRADLSTAWSVTIADGSAAGHGEFVQSSPSVSTALGKLYLGVASSEHCDLIAGRVLSVDLTTHAVTRRELLSPGQRGAGVWSSITVAEDEGRIYVTSGNQVGGREAEPLAQAIIAMDARTLEVLDHWQNPTALENSDFGSSPTIFDAGGMKLVAATNKDGFLYVLRRDALSQGPVWKNQLAVIDASDPTVGGNPSTGFGSISTPVFANGRLYAAGGQTPDGKVGSVVAFDPATGNVLWRHVTPGYVTTPMAAAGDILAVVSTAKSYKNSWLEILDQTNGNVIASFADDAGVSSWGAPSIGHGLVVWTDQDGHSRLFEAPDYR